MSVETIRDIPVIVQHRQACSNNDDYVPMDCDYFDDESGFPFDNSGRRTRDPLEELSQRHPEFAQHLQGFPRRNQRSGGEQEDDEFLRRRFDRPFSSGRFERFGFPFDRADFEREPQRYYEAYPEYFPNQQPSSPQNQQQSSSDYQQHPPQFGQEYNPLNSKKVQEEHPQFQTQVSQSVSQGTQTEDLPAAENNDSQPGDLSQEPKGESGQTRGRPIQQSNTCDLTQHQPPDEALNEREPRSMSAPPENKRFTSSVNIPMGGHQETGPGQGGGAKSQAAGSGSTERVIPIHVEGRDDPVIPRSFSTQTSAHPPQPQPERIFTESPRPQPETIFGRRPEAFTQFVRDPHRGFGNEWPHHTFGGFPEEEFGFRSTESPTRFTKQQPQQQRGQPKPEAPQQSKTQEQTSQPDGPKPQPQPPKQPLGPIEQIQAIQSDVSALIRQVEAFNGAPRDKNYLYLDEMLTRNLLKLDNVDTQGQEAIRNARKEAIKCIEKTISLLESKAAANVAPKEEMETEQQPQEAVTESEPNEHVKEEPMEESQTFPEVQNGQTVADVVESNEGQAETAEEVKKDEAETKEADGEKKEKKKTKKKVAKDDKDKQ